MSNIKLYLILIVILFNLNQIIFGEILNNTENDVILQVHVSFRHGDRTMNFSESYPTDPNRNILDKTIYPLSEGQLTNAGKQRAYKLGKMLRKRYNTFLGDLYDAEIVQVLSTDFDRTKMTAQLVLAGLFPPSKSQQWDDQLLWLPIPVDYVKKKEDKFLRRQNKFCPTYIHELKRVLNESTVKILTDNKDLIEYIEKNSGQ
ncbi:venom acid phosphatase Acph-1-like, partial [Chrysoperla carnea]|uniref:venom acid phosphatase Acph-1-like n=1 Tax=Chrysoperla carnea TaxID=189513 RepID=UPI001D087B60